MHAPVLHTISCTCEWDLFLSAVSGTDPRGHGTRPGEGNVTQASVAIAQGKMHLADLNTEGNNINMAIRYVKA